MSLTRTQYIRGPGIVQYGGTTFFSKGGIEVRHDLGIFRPETDLYGPLAPRIGQRIAEVSFTPVGSFTATECALLWPLHGFADFLGGSIFGKSGASGHTGTPTWDSSSGFTNSLVVWGKNGEKLAYTTAGVTKMPDIKFSANQTLVGSVTLTAIGEGDGTATSGWNDDWLSGASAAWVTPSGGLNPYTQPYSVAVTGGSYGTIPSFGAIETVDGVTLSFQHSVDRHETDNYGVMDMSWGALEVMASFTPVNMSVSDFMALMLTAIGTSAGGTVAGARGSVIPFAASGTGLVINGLGSGAGLSAIMANPAVLEHGFHFDTKGPRVSGVRLGFSRFLATDVPFTLTGKT